MKRLLHAIDDGLSTHKSNVFTMANFQCIFHTIFFKIKKLKIDSRSSKNQKDNKWDVIFSEIDL